ncbi:thioredoxin domain-containing protein [Clostridium botulinum]|uniref:Thioredoxin domain-containing protein n=1 Tax=Clostridium botulinum TaxID=1491 RepID=A0A846J715_CLOBO|nr:thioredoxin domain-containing protein [Clostridium botulinum]NFJ09838.1 thioredoxin domain-containing protein [Clostridium botulinum]NFK14562.1 thioredoxin domain-containing protein [Clostridium botulinum]NFM95931.1 thioredoxin domain-containing protein [Clostridium botulinum]NFO18918.1 thioredoxin domain-containing protein [Clostridium botulinum]
MGKKTNRLIKEKSPYLLQHAYNPVDWYPWGEEAFEKAKIEDKPVFLSIGYSTCHWCHVMERESFEDEEVAEALNKNFISIKVDREERPDVDNIYMNFCQAYTGSGGWPLTIIMTPDKKPFFAGTYFPKWGKYNIPGIMDVLRSISNLWREDKNKILESSNRISEQIERFQDNHREGELEEYIIEEAIKTLLDNFDNQYGGFGTYPKFPTAHYILFLLRYYYFKKDKKILDVINKTLTNMYKGGIFDHIGFGFSRYSTDNKWLVPHFEKMLYDNALLSMAYTEAYEATKNPLFKDITEKILNYVKKSMTSEEGGFYSAEDADSEGVEGKFYLWTKEEIMDILGEEEGELYCKIYDITSKGNFENKNIANLINTDLKTVDNNKDKLEKIREKLFEYREKRIHPHKDDKILTSWNALMIVAFSKAGRSLKNDNYIEIAKKSANFIIENLMDEKGTLYARIREGERGNEGFIDDYAFFLWALIELYEASFDIYYLEKSIEVADSMIDLFWHKESGGFYLYSKNSEKLLVRPKEIYDGATPSGNAVASLALNLLYYITGEDRYKDLVDKQFKFFASNIKSGPMYHLFSVMAYMYNVLPVKEITLAYREKDEDFYKFINEVNNRYIPFSIVTLNDKSNEIEKINKNIKDKIAIKDKATVYICQNYACREPITDLEEFKLVLATDS